MSNFAVSTPTRATGSHSQGSSWPPGTTAIIRRATDYLTPAAAVLSANDLRVLDEAASQGIADLLQHRGFLSIDVMAETDLGIVRALLALLRPLFRRDYLLRHLSFHLAASLVKSPVWQSELSDFEVTFNACCLEAHLPPRWYCLPVATLHSRCPPLGVQWSTRALPGLRLLQTSNAASVVLTVNVKKFCRPGGCLETAELYHAVFLAIIKADQLHDRLCWPTAALAVDGYLQRRLALIPSGLGSLTTAADAVAAIEQISLAACAASVELAKRYSAFPAMQANQVLFGLQGRTDYPDWVRRWRLQSANCQFRNRQLLAFDLSDWWLGSNPSCFDFEFSQRLISFADGVALGWRWPELCRKDQFRRQILPYLIALIQRQGIGSGETVI